MEMMNDIPIKKTESDMESGIRQNRRPVGFEVLEHLEDNPRVQHDADENGATFTLTIDLGPNNY